MAKRPLADERAPITDEWGIYDPAKAGMQALFAKLGRPVLRASAKKARQERRRGYRPERPSDGVGLAIEEAMIRAGRMSAKAEPEAPLPVPVSPARAVRIALKVAKPPVVKGPFIPASIAPSAAAKKKTVTRRAKTEAVVADEEKAAAAQVAAVEAPPKPRAARKTAKARVKAEPAAAPVTVVTPPEPAPAPVAHVPPAPSPRRPRGPVPLAAWAHAVTEAPKAEPRRADKRGFWRALFRMPAEVALVEYARGCRIHRLLIETSDDEPLLDLL